MPKKYITTAIDYPNAAPHMGHVLEKVLADVCARWFRLSGYDTRFQIGTDEHGVKNQRTAAKEGVSPKELVDRNVPLFKDLYDKLNISYDYFVRTTDQEVHFPTVIELWKKLKEAGMLEKRDYTALYCSGCERFITNKELVDGKCSDHQKAPEEVTEENWFFLLSKDSKWLKKLLTEKNGYEIVPTFRRQETLSLIEQGLEDISFSRPKSSLDWGIPVPDDEDQTMYVWCDALTNYISPLGYLTKKEDKTYWDDAEVTHVIGKDIARFHALYWPSMLKNAGVKTPDKLLVHGFLTSEGQKMSKSLGNVVVPSEVVDKYGVDPLRFYLSHEVPVGRDGDFSWDRMQKMYDSKLRNDIGNLLNRVLVLIGKDENKVSVPENPEIIEDAWQRYEEKMNNFELSEALQIVCSFVSACNAYIDKKKPWGLEGEDKSSVLGVLVECLRHIGLMLLPFVPDTAQRMNNQLGVPYADKMLENSFVIEDKKNWGSQKGWKEAGKPEILFKDLEK
jgi:methionyl-tRNA synthetase